MGVRCLAKFSNLNRVLKILTLLLYLWSDCLCNLQTNCVASYNKEEQEAIFVQLTNESIYKKWMRPHKDTKILVNTSVEIYSMASIDEMHSEFSLNLLIDLIWNDQRLAHKCEDLEDLTIEGSEWHFDRIWSPKLRVPNNKNPSAMDRDSKIILLRVSSRGNVRVRKRLTLDMYCEMDFHYYPFDNQTCLVEFASSDLSEDHLILNWTGDGHLEEHDNDHSNQHEPPFSISKSLYITGFDLDRTEWGSSLIESKGEKFGSVFVKFFLNREWHHLLLNIYFPTILVTMVSWISFWMDITATPARITLGVTTMLTFVTVGKDSRDNLPNMSYASALDIWFVICTGFIFLSLIEFIIITYISRAEKRKIKQMKTLRRTISHSQLSLSSAETQTTITTNDGLFLFPPKSPNLSTRFPFDGIEIKVPKSPRLFEKPKLLPQISPIPKKVTLSITPPDSPNPDSEKGKAPSLQIELKLTPVEIAEAIDRKCRYLFPVAFFVFNLIYWLVIFLR